MPSFVPPEAATFDVDDGKARVRIEGFGVSDASGWSLLAKPTLVVIDGPGDEGFLLRRIGPQGTDQAPAGWDDAVSRHGGVWLVVDDGPGIFAALIRSG